MRVQTYLDFKGHCEEALEYYKKTLGAEVLAVRRYADSPDKPPGGFKGREQKVLHSAFRIGDTEILASDAMGDGNPEFKGMALSLTVPSDSEANRIFNALGQGGQVQVPLTKTFFASKFGIVADKFGLAWMVSTAPERQG